MLPFAPHKDAINLDCGNSLPLCLAAHGIHIWNDDRSQRALKKDLPSCVEWKAAMNRRSPNGKSRAKEVSFGGAKGDIEMRASQEGFAT